MMFERLSTLKAFQVLEDKQSAMAPFGGGICPAVGQRKLI